LLLALLLAWPAAAPAQGQDQGQGQVDSAYLYAVSLMEGLRGHWEQSTALLKMAAEGDTASAYLREELAQRYQDLGMAPRQDGEAMLSQGLELLRSGKPGQARALMEPLSATAGEHQAVLLSALGMAADDMGDSGAAIRYLQASLALDPKVEPAYGQLAGIYERLSRTAEMLSLLEQGVAQAPESADLWSLLGAAYLDEGKAELARQRLEKAQSLGLDSPQLQYQLAVASDKLGDTATAEHELGRVIEAQPENAEALNFLGYSLADRGVELDKALDLLKRAVALEPENPYYLDSLGWAWHRQGDRERALYYIGKALGLMKEPGKDRDEVQGHLQAVQAGKPELTPAPAVR